MTLYKSLVIITISRPLIRTEEVEFTLDRHSGLVANRNRKAKTSQLVKK